MYVRYNRKRLKGAKGAADTAAALASLLRVLADTCVAMAPFTPFLTESMYQNLRARLPSDGKWPESVHFCDMPPADEVCV